ncbi:D-alanyl-D-alanine carboxypeptidase [Streptomyces sp. NPDC020951]|uniref:D-alanyl-D-alanine carboxypeptidase n=1 Tax=Streptomyces sp. NPDC020951 TaxID=3365104 RepID=UPI00379D1825
MAGESPDRSKQRESSAEPTSGSAGTVPEARESRDGAVREVRDPRVAVAREAEPSASRGGVDTATRVFSVRDLKTEDPEEPTEAAAESEAEDEDGETAESAESAAETEAEAADEGAGESEGDGEPEDAEEPTEAAAETEAEETAQDGPEGVEEAVSAPEGPAGGSGGGDERLRAAVAQWVVSADEDTHGETDGETDGDADTDVADTDVADAGAGTDVEERSESVAEEADEPEDSAPEAEAKPVSKPAPKWASDADHADETDKTGKTDKKDDKADEAESADDSPVDQPTAVFKAPRPKPSVDQPTTMLKLGDAARPKPEPGKDEAETRPEAEAKAEAEAAPEAKAKVKAETDAPPAERTSRFVALKPLDEPRLPKQDVTALVPQVGPERTTQQPLPPKPPLDLLAELTNTPPPPPTPMRTLGRRIKIWTPLVILLLVVFAIAQAVRPLPAPALTLTAKDAYTFDGGKTQLPWPNEGQGWMDIDGVGTMGSFGKQTPVAIGSVAKTMTAYIVLKDHPMKAGEEGPEIEIDATAEKEGGYDVTGDESTLNTVKAGDKLTEKQALSAVLIPSANNIARLLARWDAGSEAAFVKKMNATAKELGMTNTTYTDPSGLKETTVSTAEDQVKLGRAFVQVPALVAISGAASWTDPSGKYWNNYNELPYLIGAIGIKTGSTTAAGGNLLFASRKEVDGRTVTIVGAVLGQHKQKILATVNAVSKTALLAAQDALTSAKIVKKGDVVGYVDDKMGHHTPVVVTKDVPAVGWAGLTVKLSFAAGEVPHTAKAGAQVGTLTVGDGSSSAVKVPVTLQTDLVEPGFTDKLTRIG